MTFSLLDIMYAEIAEATCSFCFKPCDRYLSPNINQCLDYRTIDAYMIATRKEDHAIYHARKNRQSLLEQVAEERKRIEEQIVKGGKHPDEVDQSYYIRLQIRLVDEEKRIELMDGIYCVDCTNKLQFSSRILPFH